MSKLTLSAALCLALAFGGAHAAPHAASHSDEKHADERHADEKHADEKHEDGRHTQANRMKTCSADAKARSLKGDERKSFMSDCLKKKS